MHLLLSVSLLPITHSLVLPPADRKGNEIEICSWDLYIYKTGINTSLFVVSSFHLLCSISPIFNISFPSHAVFPWLIRKVFRFYLSTYGKIFDYKVMNLILEKLFLSDRIFLLFSICFSFPLKEHKLKKTWKPCW